MKRTLVMLGLGLMALTGALALTSCDRVSPKQVGAFLSEYETWEDVPLPPGTYVTPTPLVIHRTNLGLRTHSYWGQPNFELAWDELAGARYYEVEMRGGEGDRWVLWKRTDRAMFRPDPNRDPPACGPDVNIQVRALGTDYGADGWVSESLAIRSIACPPTPTPTPTPIPTPAQ